MPQIIFLSFFNQNQKYEKKSGFFLAKFSAYFFLLLTDFLFILSFCVVLLFFVLSVFFTLIRFLLGNLFFGSVWIFYTFMYVCMYVMYVFFFYFYSINRVKNCFLGKVIFLSISQERRKENNQLSLTKYTYLYSNTEVYIFQITMVVGGWLLGE